MIMVQDDKILSIWAGRVLFNGIRFENQRLQGVEGR